ncbi:hypothetical protein ELS24_11575 [Achromobacter spanius]|nr:hypothetical protein [Achromobacter spanius]AZS79033.1 hypothetical protein ELS24_11575 [Achromobacter spanius]
MQHDPKATSTARAFLQVQGDNVARVVVFRIGIQLACQNWRGVGLVLRDGIGQRVVDDAGIEHVGCPRARHHQSPDIERLQLIA